MKQKIILILLSVAAAYSSIGQGLNNNWLMGYSSFGGFPFGNTRFDFTGGSLNMSFDSLEMQFKQTHTNISDTQGNLLFYTNGYYIADASNDTMQNGSGINPGAYANSKSDGFLIPQAALIIPQPGSSNLYYMFHNTADAYPVIPNSSVSYHFYLTTIDMSLNNGLGAVVSKNQILLTDSMNVGKITACKHANGRDWWVFCHRVNSNKFYRFLVTTNNLILGPYSQNIGAVRPDDAGQAWFSPDGKRFAYFYLNGGLDIFDFNRCTGVLSNPVHVQINYNNGYNVGLAFSPNSNVLYVSNVYNVYQLDLTAADIAASFLPVAAYDSFVSTCSSCVPFQTLFALAGLAPDGKIYISTGNGTLYWHTIDNPDVVGMGCNVNQHSVQLPALYFNTVPNHPNYFLECDSTLGCLCASTTNLTPYPSPKERGVTAMPNPNDGNFMLQFDVMSISGVLEIYDVMGKLVYKDYVSAWSQFKKVNLTPALSKGEGVSGGIYNCILKRGSEIENVKVIIEK
jgi:hypothetical protein